MKQTLFMITLLAMLITLLPGLALAQEPEACSETYTVQAGDWLSKIAEKYLGDALAYPEIASATNGQTDDTFANVDNPDLIEPGWLLCIPGAGVAAGAAPSTGNTAPGGGVAGTDWILTSLNGQPVLEEAPVTDKFGADGMVTGTDGCNNYGAGYQVDGNSVTLTPGPSTMMACPDPIMQQSTAYMAALGSSATFKIQGDKLLLKDTDGNVVAAFSALKPVSLSGSSWRVLSYNNGKQAVVSVIIGMELTANFGEDGSLTGFAGCNNYNSTYKIDDENNIAIGPAAATMMMCAEPEGVMEQEQQYLAALQTAATYSIELNRMDMRTAEGSRVATFELVESKMPAAPEEAKITGTVTYRQKVALPDNAVVTVQLQDVSPADAPATVIGEQVIPTNSMQVPILFEVTYDPGVIQDNHTYALSVRIEDGAGNLLFINTQSYPVITNGNPTDNVEVVVDPV